MSARGASPSLFLILCVCSTLAAAGCTRRDRADRVIEFWAMGREGEAVQNLLKGFEARHPHVAVRVQQIPWSAAHEKLLTAFVGNAMPDVFQAGTTWLPELAALGAVEPLGDRATRLAGIPMEDYFPGILEANTIDDSLIGVPWYVDTRLLFYRSDLLAQAGRPGPPRSWEAWVADMDRLRAGRGRDRYAIFLPINEWEMPVILALQTGAHLLRDDDQYADFRSPAFRRAFDFYLDLFRRGFAPLAAATQMANLYRDFASGLFCFYVTGPWNIGEFRHRLPPTMAARWATAPMPGPDDQYPGISIVGGASLVLFRGSRHKDAAWEMIRYLSEAPQQVRFYQLTGDLPARKSAWEDPALREDEALRAFRLQLRHVQSPPRIPEWEQVAQEIARYSEAAIRGQLDSEQALAALDHDVDQLLEKRRWLIRNGRLQPLGDGR